MREDDVDLELHQLGEQGREPVVFAVGPAVFDDEVASLLIAEITHAAAERRGALGQTVGHGQTEKADAGDLAAALRVGRERWRREHGADERQEFASFHLTERHSIPASQEDAADYRIGTSQSAGQIPATRREGARFDKSLARSPGFR